MSSEEDLAEILKLMMGLSASPETYPDIIKTDALDKLVMLLSHENTDIIHATIDLFNEWTDEDAVAETTEEGEEGMIDDTHPGGGEGGGGSGGGGGAKEEAEAETDDD